MEIHGNLDLRNNQLRQAVLPLENGFPINPQPGRILFREQDRTLYVCAEMGDLPVWVPCAQVKSMFRYSQDTPALEWTVDHGLNISPVLLQVYDTDGNWIVPDEIVLQSNTRALVKFNTPTAGTAIALRGEMFGSPAETLAYEQDFASSTTWVVTHGLGYNPDIKVYVDNLQVQPASIVHDSLNQATITFTTPQAGFVRCF